MTDKFTEDQVFQELHANAWCGEEAHGPMDDQFRSWGMHRNLPRARFPLAPEPLNLADWTDPRVGWGVIVPDRDDFSAKDKAQGADLAEPIKELIRARGRDGRNAPVLRYRSDIPAGYLRRYGADGQYSDLNLQGSSRGIGSNAIPYYLLIVGSPKEIPWSLQIQLQPDWFFVGRLDLESEGLSHYVQALLNDWQSSSNDRRKPVIWAVDHGHPDITRTMRRTIADLLVDKFVTDSEFDMRDGYATDKDADHDHLVAMLRDRHPAFVVTSSHGATYPLNNPQEMSGRLGLPVDNTRSVMDPNKLIAGDWSSHGVVWYAHACCSAGSDSTSHFAGIVDESSSLGQTLDSITKIGASQAPLPKALLGNANPARCFIGHVEPTFNWTLFDPINNQATTAPIIETFYGQMHLALAPPVGLAMHHYYRSVAGLLLRYADALGQVNAHIAGAKDRASFAKLIAADRLAMVILGDPTVRLPLAA